MANGNSYDSATAVIAKRQKLPYGFRHGEREVNYLVRLGEEIEKATDTPEKDRAKIELCVYYSLTSLAEDTRRKDAREILRKFFHKNNSHSLLNFLEATIVVPGSREVETTSAL